MDEQEEEVINILSVHLPQLSNQIVAATEAIMQNIHRPDIQRQRARIHETVRQYRHYERALCSRRAQAIRRTLLEFRATEYATFRRQCVKLKRQLRKLYKLERQAVLNNVGEDAFEAVENIMGSGGYMMETWVPSGFGPLRPRFWGSVESDGIL